MVRAWLEHGRRPASDPGVVSTIYEEFPLATNIDDVPHGWFTIAQERRAALNLHAFTGLTPSRVDDGQRDAAVDLLLEGEGQIIVAEVTSNATDRDEKAYDRSERLVARIHALYDGPSHWVLHFGRAYSPPLNARRAKTFAMSVVTELRDWDQSGRDGIPLSTASWLVARRLDDGGTGVEGVSWDSRVPPWEGTFGDGFRNFFDTPLIESKRAKLIAEGERLHATERHLYLFTTPTGGNAHLFPGHPWFLADGAIALPPGIDVLWIDTRAEFTFRYSDRDGATGHRN